MPLEPKTFTRYTVYALGFCAFCFVQHRRWKHAQLMKRHWKCNTIGYQVPGGLFVAITPTESSPPKELTNEEKLKNRWYIDLKCQVYKHDERLSSFDPQPFWFDVPLTRTVTVAKDQDKP